MTTVAFLDFKFQDDQLKTQFNFFEGPVKTKLYQTDIA